jgi:alpha-tubulin suppressor-like RCC1 family protein
MNVATVAAGNFHALALTRCGRVYSWGTLAHDVPEHGRGIDSDDSDDGDNFDNHVPQVITALLGKIVRAIAVGPRTSCAVTDEGALYTWGTNNSGSLGHGDVRDRDKPTLVTALQDIRVVGVSLYTDHGLSLAADGSVTRLARARG